MTVKSVIDIDVNDQAFKNFAAMFAKYQEALKSTPGAWKEIADEVGKTGTVFEQILAAMLAQKAITDDISKKEQEAAAAAEKKRKEEAAAARSGMLHWKDMARTTRDVAGNIVNATTALLKWTGLTAAFSGLLGAGGLYGIDRMAAGVASGRRSSQGMGVTYGEQKAFDINYGSIVDSDAYLTSVNEALHDVTKRKGLYGAGLSQAEQQGDAATVGATLLNHMKKIADNTDPSMMENVMKANSLDQFGDLKMMMRLRAASWDDVNSGKFNKDSKELNLDPATQTAWLHFIQTMERAGNKIENVFVRGLVKLEEPLERLSEGFVKMIETFANSDAVKHAIDDLGVGLEKFAGYINTSEFEEDVKKFATDVGILVTGLEKLADGVGWVLKKLGVGSEPVDPTHGGLVTPSTDKRSAWERWVKPALSHGASGSWGAPTAPGGASGNWDAPTVPGVPTSNDVKQTDLINALYGAESSYGADKRTSSAGAVGPLQLMPRTALAYGVKDSRDLGQATAGVSRMLSDLNREFKGDLAKIAAAYNWGSGNLESYMKTGHGIHNQPMPKETIDYLRKISETLSKQTGRPIMLTISNPSGANVVTSTSQLAPAS